MAVFNDLCIFKRENFMCNLKSEKTGHIFNTYTGKGMQKKLRNCWLQPQLLPFLRQDSL